MADVTITKIEPKVSVELSTTNVNIDKNKVVTVVAGVQGLPGPKGDPGDQGPPGNEAQSVNFIQSTPTSTWTINHNLGYKPIVNIFSVGGLEVDATIIHTSDNQCVITFNVDTAGSARLI